MLCGADIGRRHHASVRVDKHVEENHSDRRTPAFPEAALEGAHP